jgi:hypothetical protein
MLDIKENIIDNVLFDQLKRELNYLPWFFIENTAYGLNPSNIFDFSWQHIAIIDSNDNSYFSGFTRKLIQSILDNQKIKYERIIKARYGLITALPNRVIHAPHVDLTEPHQVGLIYLNDSDGDTYFFNADDYFNLKYKDNIDIMKTVSPKQNRLVLFDGSIFHSSSSPNKVSHRITLNFCFNT